MTFSSLRAAFALTKQHARTTLLFVVLGSVLGFVFLFTNALTSVFSWGALAFIGVCVLVLILGSLLRSALFVHLTSEQPLGFVATWRASYGRAWKLFLISVVYMLVVLGGSLMLLLPGLVFATFFVFAPYIYIVEGEKNIFAALWKSTSYVHGHFWKLLLRVVGWLLGIILVGLVYHVLNLYASVVFTTLGSFLALLIFELVISSYIVVLIAAYFFVRYRNIKLAQTPPVIPIVMTGGKKAFVWVVGFFGILCLFTVPVLLAAYNIGAQQNELRAFEAQYMPFGTSSHGRTYVSHLFGIMFNYPVSWSDAGSVQTFKNDPTIVAYFTHNDLGGYNKRFILRKFNTKETVLQYKAGYEANIQKMGGTISGENMVSGTYTAVVTTAVAAHGLTAAYQETHYVVAFPASNYGLTGLFTVDFYDKSTVYLADFSQIFSVVSASLTSRVPSDISSTHDGR